MTPAGDGLIPLTEATTLVGCESCGCPVVYTAAMVEAHRRACRGAALSAPPEPGRACAYRLLGYDAFSAEWYPLDSRSGGYDDGYDDHELALAAARRRLAELEIRQPSRKSGGQQPGGIQDRVFIEHPDGARERVVS